MAVRKATKHSIPHTKEDCTLVGILEQVHPDSPTHGSKIALILHGTMGHKDYLFQKRLAARLPIDSFRFDFRGNHESGGRWKQGAFREDVEDLKVVVAYLRTTFGYEVDVVVGHSRGSIVGMHWMCTSEEGKYVRAYVNASGRYRMHRIYDGTEAWKEEFDTKGYHEWKVTVARKAVVARVYPSDLAEFATWDTSIVWTQFPPQADVLSIHGLLDKTVPPFDALIYARALGSRTPGTHNLHLVEDADHNFTGRQDEVVDCILEWYEARTSGSLSSGIWMTGRRGKL
ncbi:ectomycorrhiza-regulated esterase [Coniophora puteana RWD-64-598 SS2]|uniref:Ectomycorrhiza-regulated esterase n=1 Tax=Coniophora puteana (strain RWD-64-598) TaxID=741705 RepID=A0A5M3MPV9_CONPW|nr:ectomycorrhiza-regulated esterase [Coniophora puteana RWD-64-598 SS2]EIW81097.1 ectomycorrhiza-regulated esterase [Coniophora puteana RWD-64-598 SS2]